MAKTIGPSFSLELQAAGLLGLPFSWGSDGTFAFGESVTPQQISGVMAVYAAHDPNTVTAALARLGVDAAEVATLKADGTWIALINQTRAQWVTWAQSNLPSLTAAEQVRFGNLFWVVAIAVRRWVRNGT